MIRDAAELRVKETDRIAAVVAELQRLGLESTFRSRGRPRSKSGKQSR